MYHICEMAGTSHFECPACPLEAKICYFENATEALRTINEMTAELEKISANIELRQERGEIQ